MKTTFSIYTRSQPTENDFFIKRKNNLLEEKICTICKIALLNIQAVQTNYSPLHVRRIESDNMCLPCQTEPPMTFFEIKDQLLKVVDLRQNLRELPRLLELYRNTPDTLFAKEHISTFIKDSLLKRTLSHTGVPFLVVENQHHLKNTPELLKFYQTIHSPLDKASISSFIETQKLLAPSSSKKSDSYILFTKKIILALFHIWNKEHLSIYQLRSLLQDELTFRQDLEKEVTLALKFLNYDLKQIHCLLNESISPFNSSFNEERLQRKTSIQLHIKNLLQQSADIEFCQMRIETSESLCKKIRSAIWERPFTEQFGRCQIPISLELFYFRSLHFWDREKTFRLEDGCEDWYQTHPKHFA